MDGSPSFGEPDTAKHLRLTFPATNLLISQDETCGLVDSTRANLASLGMSLVAPSAQIWILFSKGKK
jgi:hypothetical protein